MKKLKKIIIKYFFCGTEEEYEEGKPIFTEEAKIYTKRPTYLIGAVLFGGGLISLMILFEYSWLVILIVCLSCTGELLIRDTIIEHYVVKLLRERKNKNDKK
jgi:hypothetical protein